MQRPAFSLVWLVVDLCLVTAPAISEDGLDRFSMEKLVAVHSAVENFRRERVDLQRPGTLEDYRANLHVHSAFSHDSNGKIEEIIAAAKRVNTKIIMFTEHPAEHYDFYLDGHRGFKEGVLLIPGAEMSGLHVYPQAPVIGPQQMSAQEICDQVAGRDGMLFLCHLEERMDWELVGLTGSEIYNTHADFKDEKRLMEKIRNPLWLLGAASRVKQFPQEAYSALQDYPGDYLRRWDELCANYPHTGVSANDAHQNVGFRGRVTAEGKVCIEDALGEKIIELERALFIGLMPEAADAQPDTVIFQLQLDPYENALRHVGTHLLMPELSESEVWKALRTGRAFVAFDWIADSTGFDIALIDGQKRFEMGSKVDWHPQLRLVGQSPLNATWKVIKDGTVVAETGSNMLDIQVSAAGRYRVELWLDVAGKALPWVLSNPFYVSQP